MRLEPAVIASILAERSQRRKTQRLSNVALIPATVTRPLTTRDVLAHLISCSGRSRYRL
jgi:hypothetical protein